MLSYKITSPTDARNDFFKLLDLVVENHQVYIINRRDSENVALIAESDLVSLVETVYLLRRRAAVRQRCGRVSNARYLRRETLLQYWLLRRRLRTR